MEFVEAIFRDQGLIEHWRFVEFVGRLVYASQVLVWMNPFICPLHSWKAAISGGSVVTAPRMVMTVLAYL